MKKEFNYTLLDPIHIAKDGKQVQASKIVIQPPRPRDRVNSMRLESIFKQCFLKFASSDFLKNNPQKQIAGAEDKEDEQSKSDSLIMILMMGAKNDSFEHLIFIMQNLLCDGNLEFPQATLDEIKITRPIFDSIGVDDLKNIIGRYLHHFLSSSLI